MASFSISDSVSYGWQTTKKNFKFFFILLLILLAVNIVPNMLSWGENHPTMFSPNNGEDFLVFIINIIGWVLQMVVSLGLIGIALKIHDKKKVEYKNLFDYFRLVIPYIFGSIVYGLVVLVGLILLIVPGIIWGIKFRYYTYFMVDKNMGPIDAMKESSKITQGNKWNLFLFGLVMGLINILGFLALFVGLLVTIPISMMAEAYVFRKLSK